MELVNTNKGYFDEFENELTLEASVYYLRNMTSKYFKSSFIKYSLSLSFELTNLEFEITHFPPRPLRLREISLDNAALFTNIFTLENPDFI